MLEASGIGFAERRLARPPRAVRINGKLMSLQQQIKATGGEDFGAC